MHRRIRLHSIGTEMATLMASKMIIIFSVLSVTVSTTDAFAQQVSNAFAQPTQVRNLSPQTLIRILDKYRGKPYDNFRRFVLDLYLTGKPMLTLEQHNAIGDFAVNKRIAQPRRSWFIGFSVCTHG